LSPGYYSVSVIDGSGCLVTDSVLIPNSVYVDLQLDSLNSILDVNCYGDQSSGIMFGLAQVGIKHGSAPIKIACSYDFRILF
jgi:hypothetical protein